MNEIIPPGPGGWMWDGTQWTCCPGGGAGLPCPPGPPPWFPPPQGQPPWYPGANGGVSFSPPGSPPPNPIRGAFWWDGAILWMFDGAAWEDVGVANAASGGAGGGAFTGSSPPANPSNGALWFNGTTMFIWDGNAWVPASATKTYVQATAPPAPNAGDQWWNGAQQFIWDGSAWQKIGPGATVGPVPTTTIAFSLVQAANLSITPSTGSSFTETPWVSTPTIDTMAGYDQTTKKWTPTKPGIYMVTILGWNVASGGGAYAQAVLKNDQGVFNWGTPVEMVSIYDFINATPMGVFGAMGLCTMNGTTDYLRHWSWTGNGTIYALPSNTPTWRCIAMP